jgi:hypothetical protein
MILNHTSPKKIGTINPMHEYFQGCLFFSEDIYTMTASSTIHHYIVEVDEDQVIHVSDLNPSNDIIDYLRTDIDCLFDIDLDDDSIISLITEEETPGDMIEYYFEDQGRDLFDFGFEKIGELSWIIQGYQAKVAREMDFLACESEDEQGSVWMINLVNKENLLTYRGEIK